MDSVVSAAIGRGPISDSEWDELCVAALEFAESAQDVERPVDGLHCDGAAGAHPVGEFPPGSDLFQDDDHRDDGVAHRVLSDVLEQSQAVGGAESNVSGPAIAGYDASVLCDGRVPAVYVFFDVEQVKDAMYCFTRGEARYLPDHRAADVMRDFKYDLAQVWQEIGVVTDVSLPDFLRFNLCGIQDPDRHGVLVSFECSGMREVDDMVDRVGRALCSRGETFARIRWSRVAYPPNSCVMHVTLQDSRATHLIVRS